MQKDIKEFLDQKKFSWLHLIIATAVVGLILLILSLLLNNAQEETRDTKRVADIQTMRFALELYFQDCGHYPTALIAGKSISSVEECNGQVYLAKISSDPLSGEAYPYVPCSGNGPYTCKAGIVKPSYYKLGYYLEGNTGGQKKGTYIATPIGIANN